MKGNTMDTYRKILIKRIKNLDTHISILLEKIDNDPEAHLDEQEKVVELTFKYLDLCDDLRNNRMTTVRERLKNKFLKK